MGKYIESSKKIHWSQTDSYNNSSWYTDIDGFLEHSPSEGSLYCKVPTLQKVIQGFLGVSPCMTM